MKIGLLNIATNKYIEFADPLYESANKHFLSKENFDVTYFLFTNEPDRIKRENVRVIHQEHYPWPGMTLRRYEIFYKHTDILLEMDYLYYCDIDMIFENYIGKEIIGDLVVTRHPGYWNQTPYLLPYDRNSISKAFIPFDQGQQYYAGGFNGGTTKEFLKMSRVIYSNIEADKKNGYIAQWHDESHLNRYVIDNPPSIILDPSYCFPRDAIWAQQHPYREYRKLCALEKNHKDYQV